MQKKAVGIISGGLDSTLALRLVKEQGFDITALHILTPFVSGFGDKTVENLKRLAEEEGFQLRVIKTGAEYTDMIRKPVFGYGKNLNPCIDCHIYMLKIARIYMEKIGALFVFTGEVLGQRGKSQTKKALESVEKGAGLKGKLLRPLSAKLLPPTDAENDGLIDRERMLSIHGKTRTLQMSLAEEKNLKFYNAPAGGCLLTEKNFCNRLKDLIETREKPDEADYFLLQTGRHFRVSNATKIIVSRDEKEARKICKIAEGKKPIITSPEHPGPVAVLDGAPEKTALEIFASYAGSGKMRLHISEPDGKVHVSDIDSKDKLSFHKFLL